MKYYKIEKNDVLIAIGKTDKDDIPKNDNVFKYSIIDLKEYNRIDKEEFNTENNKK